MSGGYEVLIQAIERSAAAAKRAAEGVGRVDLAGALAGVAQGLPGGAAVEAARLLGDRWQRELPTWVRNMDDYSEQLTRAARRYRADDEAAAHDLRTIAVPGSTRPFRW
jgi:hypothetical protein